MEGEKRCCKCEEFKWPDDPPLEVVWTDPADEKKSYCVFHAPKDKKKRLSGERISPSEFNILFRAKVTKTLAASNGMHCHLRGIVFPGDLDFSQLTATGCIGPLTLHDSTFCGSIKCRDCVVKYIDVTDSTFCGEVDFSGSYFIDCMTFLRTHFCERVNFSNAEFGKSALFTSAKFSAAVWFSECTFYEDIILQAITANDKLILVRKISKQSLSKIRLHSFEVNKFCFTECDEWPDDFGFENEIETSIQYREELYCAMKRQALELHDQQQASHWHFSEKMMKLARQTGEEYKRTLLRQDKTGGKKSWIRRCWIKFKLGIPLPLRSLTWWYGATSGFGERAVRAGVWLLALVALSFVLNATPQPMDWNTLWGADAANATLATIPFAKDIPGDGWVKAGRGFWQFLIALQFTLFALAVRNRFRR